MGVPLTEIIFLAICKELKLSDNYKDTTNRKITNPFGGELKVEAPATGSPGYGYSLTLAGLPTSACISLGTLNLATSTAAYAIDGSGSGTPSFPSGKDKGPISPADAATQCTSDSNANAPIW